MKNWCFFHRKFSELLLFFSTWRPSRNTVFYISGGTCSFFCFLVFSSKNDQNLMKTWKPWKTYKNDSRRDPQMSLISRTFFVISAEIVNMAPQRCVFERSIFWQIFGITKSTSQGATGNPYRANSEGPGPPGSMTKVMLDWKSYRMKGLPRIQHASEPLARRIT